MALALIMPATAVMGQSAAEDLNIPEPEEIVEALQIGLIEYEDYLRLLEIVESGRIAPEDSLYLRGFSNLINASTGNPLLETDDDPDIAPETKIVGPPIYQQTLLVRQTHKLESDSDQRSRLHRLHAQAGDFAVGGQFEKDYSGRYSWGRRSLTYRAGKDSPTVATIGIGNFHGQFGSGLIYGYHGVMLSKDSDRASMEKFLYPRYGGTNGAVAKLSQGHFQINGILDIDRNQEFAREFAGVSATHAPGFGSVGLTGAWGRVRNRVWGQSEDAGLASLTAILENGPMQIEWELAGAIKGKLKTMATAGKFQWKAHGVTLNAIGWHYDDNFPSWFSGGPSSRRYQSRRIDKIGLSYRDRFSGETGGVVRTSTRITRNMSVQTAAAYAWRAPDDNRSELRVALKRSLDNRTTIKAEAFAKYDNPQTSDGASRRIQVEVRRAFERVTARLGVGYRFDRNAVRNDWSLHSEGTIHFKAGKLRLLNKLDRLRLAALNNQQAYGAIAFESSLSKNISAVAKYTYRYRRADRAVTYETFRWDLLWAIN